MMLRLLFSCTFLLGLIATPLSAQGVTKELQTESATFHNLEPKRMLMSPALKDGPWTDFTFPLFFQAIDPDSQPVADVELFLMRDVSFLLCEACRTYKDEPQELNPDLITQQAKRLEGMGSSTDQLLIGTYHLYAIRDDMGLPIVVGHRRFSIPGPHSIMIQVE
jgi:hypothetical protein